MTRIEMLLIAALLAARFGVPVDVARLARALDEDDEEPTIRLPRLEMQ